MANVAPGKIHEKDFLVPELPIATAGAAKDLEGESDALAPLIFNCWYVIALSRDVDRTLRHIKVLGEPLVYYRTEDGRPIVLDDRCAHRRFRLSKGRLKGDTIQCGYHGFTYASSGQCIWAPGVPVTEGRAKGFPFGVRSYPCAERGPWLWVWMGKPELANPDEIPLPEFEALPDRTAYGYVHNPSNYMLVIENLLDLSHLHFLHAAADLTHVEVVPHENTTPENGPLPENGIAWKKRVDRSETGLIATFCGENPQRLVNLTDELIQYGPSLTFGSQRREALEGDSEPARPALMLVIHALTPLDSRNTHQFFVFSMSDPLVKDPSELLHMTQDVIFKQDVEVVGDMQTYMEEDVRPGRVEFSMIYDRFGMKMRRILNEMKRCELQEP